MGDPETPNADETRAVAPTDDAPQDPVQAAKDEAWLAQFRADNAAKVMEYDFKATAETQAEAKAAEARRDYDLSQAEKIEKQTSDKRAEAERLEKKALEDKARHDEYEAQALTARHLADAAQGIAAHLREDAKEADAAAQRLGNEVEEQYKHFEKDQAEYELIQQQAVAAQRIADNEAKLAHPGDPAPDDAGAEAPAP
jgi:hypothetical protein